MFTPSDQAFASAFAYMFMKAGFWVRRIKSCGWIECFDFGFCQCVRSIRPAGASFRLFAGAIVAIYFGCCQCIGHFFFLDDLIVQLAKGLQAIANPTRLRILELLKDPGAFDGPRGENGKPLGVTAKALLRHLRVAQPTLSEHMEKLIRIGLVESTTVGRWVVYTRDEERIRQLKQTIIDQLLPPA